MNPSFQYVDGLDSAHNTLRKAWRRSSVSVCYISDESPATHRPVVASGAWQWENVPLELLQLAAVICPNCTHNEDFLDRKGAVGLSYVFN